MLSKPKKERKQLLKECEEIEQQLNALPSAVDTVEEAEVIATYHDGSLAESTLINSPFFLPFQDPLSPRSARMKAYQEAKAAASAAVKEEVETPVASVEPTPVAEAATATQDAPLSTEAAPAEEGIAFADMAATEEVPSTPEQTETPAGDATSTHGLESTASLASPAQLSPRAAVEKRKQLNARLMAKQENLLSVPKSERKQLKKECEAIEAQIAALPPTEGENKTAEAIAEPVAEEIEERQALDQKSLLESITTIQEELGSVQKKIMSEEDDSREAQERVDALEAALADKRKQLKASKAAKLKNENSAEESATSEAAVESTLAPSTEPEMKTAIVQSNGMGNETATVAAEAEKQAEKEEDVDAEDLILEEQARVLKAEREESEKNEKIEDQTEKNEKKANETDNSELDGADPEQAATKREALYHSSEPASDAAYVAWVESGCILEQGREGWVPTRRQALHSVTA